jgi:hypothetical protein
MIEHKRHSYVRPFLAILLVVMTFVPACTNGAAPKTSEDTHRETSRDCVSVSPRKGDGELRGNVYDGRSSSSSAVRPDNLKGVDSAVVRINGSALKVVSDRSGSFCVSGLRADKPYTLIDIDVTAPGFAHWRGSDLALYPKNPLHLTIELTTHDETSVYTPPPI